MLLHPGARFAAILLALCCSAQHKAPAPGPARPRLALPVPLDCNGNGVDDQADIAQGRSLDCDGNLVPDECDLGRATLLAESFEAGIPATWTAAGLWHATSECSPIPRCDGTNYAYFGSDSNCTFEFAGFAANLTAPTVLLPSDTTSIELSYCSAYEGEGEDPYDSADVFVNDILVDHASPTAQFAWDRRTIDLTNFAGQAVSIDFRFTTMDAFLNIFLGWQVDDVRLSYAIGSPGTDCNLNGVPDACEPDCDLDGLPDDCELTLGADVDCNYNGVPDACDVAGGTSPDCNLNAIPDECDVSISLPAALTNLQANHADITALFPDTYFFDGGQVGFCINEGGDSFMFDCGNTISTNLSGLIAYTNSTAVSTPDFGPGSSYFTAKYPGLFVMAAVDCSIDTLEINGTNVVGGGTVDSLEMTISVEGLLYTLYVKRWYTPILAPSINQMLIVPGDGAGIAHSFSPNGASGEQILDGLAGIDRVFYVLVSRRSSEGPPLRPVDAREIARELIENFPAPVAADGDDDGIPDECP